MDESSILLPMMNLQDKFSETALKVLVGNGGTSDETFNHDVAIKDGPFLEKDHAVTSFAICDENVVFRAGKSFVNLEKKEINFNFQGRGKNAQILV